MNIKQKFIPKGTKARSGYAMTPKYITLHNTANTKKGADAESHADYLSGSGKNSYVSYHYVVDDKEIYQLLPDNEMAWHAGDGSTGTGNRQSLAIEICENSDGDILKATNLAVELTAYLMKKYGISINNVVQHNKWSGKNCPNRIRKGDPYNWTTFKNKVMDAYNGTTLQNVKPLSSVACRIKIGYASAGDINTIRGIIENLGIKAATANGYITTNVAVSAGDQITILAKCKELGIDCVVYKDVPVTGLQATSLKNMSEERIIEKVGALFTADQKKTGVLASVSLAQFILESSYGKSELAQNANNCFGMKKSLSGNTWSGSVWDGSVYSKRTQEFENGAYKTITADFRKYSCIEDSIADHSAYLIGAKNGNSLRYAGLKGEIDYKKAITIIKNGGYATSPTYIDSVCDIIEKWNLTKYDVPTSSSTNTPANAVTGNKLVVGDEIKLVSGAKYTTGKVIPNWVIRSKLYFRGTTKKGYVIFSTQKTGAVTGTVESKYIETNDFKSYRVKVICKELNIRKTPNWNKSDIVGTIKNGGVYTIIDEIMLDGTKFGLLKSSERNGVNYRDRWISLGSAYVRKM